MERLEIEMQRKQHKKSDSLYVEHSRQQSDSQDELSISSSYRKRLHTTQCDDEDACSGMNTKTSSTNLVCEELNCTSTSGRDSKHRGWLQRIKSHISGSSDNPLG
jgi:hypothetical protein